METRILPDLEREIKRIKKRDKRLAAKIEKQLDLFKQDGKHPSLRLHKLTGEMKGIWSLSIDMQIRMLYFLDEDIAYFFDIGTHDEVYRNK